ncbi:hypothetical protein ACQZ6V_10505 [Agrobacterium sp. 22-3674b3]
MNPPKSLPKPVRKSGGGRSTKLADQMVSQTVEFSASQDAHFDNYSVSQFSYAMRIKLAIKRNEGRGGWQNKDYCSGEYLSRLLREHVEKGDPVDVANFCMMLHQRGENISTGFNHVQDVERRSSPADKIIGQIEDRFPNWRSYRDLIDCIDCTLHELRAAAPAKREG